MTPERWQEVDRIFQAALDRDVSTRSAFLDQVCAGDADLRRDVDSLLGAHDSDERLLESNALKHAARDLAGDMPRLSPGQRLGAYELIEQIGAGGMGEVWRALDPPLRRHVAIKVLSSQYSRDPDRLRRFEQEAQAAGMLNHPNVLAIYAVGEQEHSPYLVTELLEGGTLRERLERGPILEGKTIEYGDQIVQGLAAAHTKGIVHRDLKPENIFITAGGHVKILDFGLAKLAPSGPEHQVQTQTASGIALGTPAYMSPEQVRGQAADHRADIFAVGAVLYEMLSGRRPFGGETSVETMNAILKQDPAPLTGVTPQLEQIVRHCLEKEPSDRYQSARDLGFQLRLVRHPSSPTPAPLPTRTGRRASVVVVLILVAATAGVTWWLTRPSLPLPPPTFTRLTSDSGLTTDPAFSQDGQLLAYASDRARAGNLDIWRQQLATGEAVPLTSDPADESEPHFSRDGSRIAFRSERDGGGIYVVSSFGGEPRLVAPHGRRPRFSPDGSRIAYWIGVWYVGRVFTVPSSGGPASPVAPDFASALHPIWSPDGANLLMVAARDPQEIPNDAYDWWVVPASGGPPVKTGAFNILRQQRIREGRQQFSLIAPGAWLENRVYFSGWSDDSTNLWRIAVSTTTAKADGSAERLTSGTSVETKPSLTDDGRITFSSLTQSVNIWSLPITADGGKVTSDPQQVTSSAFDGHNSVSADGKKLVFVSTRSGNPDIWIKDLVSGKESALTATALREQQPEITPDGSRVIYMTDEPNFPLYQIATSGGVAERICDDCGRPWDWSPNGKEILYLIPEGRRVRGMAFGLFDVVTRKNRDYFAHLDYTLSRPRISPDGRWIAFRAGNIDKHFLGSLVVSPFDNVAPTVDRWRSITPPRAEIENKPRWSADGNLLYYLSDADGFRCIRAQPLDLVTKRPLGQPLEVYHSHSARRSLMNAPIAFSDLAATSDRLFFNVGETTGNIWMAEWKR